MAQNEKSTILDVAEEAGVSVATVSRIINSNYPINEISKRVHNIIERLHYEPSVRKFETTIGIVVPSFYNIFFAEVIHGIEDYVNYDSRSLILNRSQGSAQHEKSCIIDLMERNVSGIIVISPNMSGIDEEFYKKVAQQMPLVFINGYHQISGAYYVMNNEAKGTLEALKYLFELNHKKILFIRGINSDSYEIKESTYKNFMQEKGIDANNYIVNIGEGNSTDTMDITTDILVDILPETDATAIFCCNDLMGVGAINACQKLGKRIPEDISIMGYDNIFLSRIVEPKLTTMDQNMFQLGYNAATILFMGNTTIGRSRHITLDNVLIERNSTGYNHN
ncbi:MAG: LacI family DNA-binding transcriptional regulator [Selenomonadaceae bacterium]|nr:LacI family DNA-binding transcriptional regulator [Selenomonadaceae bacterium]MBR1859670.1 LacI family DNA-binding transcriptional regulator [Selenomonadaceae bacterium]